MVSSAIGDVVKTLTSSDDAPKPRVDSTWSDASPSAATSSSSSIAPSSEVSVALARPMSVAMVVRSEP